MTETETSTQKDSEDWVPVALPIPGHWSYVDFEEALAPIPTSKIKIAQKNYLEEGEHPVIDQGQFFIGGYTNSRSNLIDEDRSLIVFGDHTKCFKFVAFPFAPGADGTKVLKPRNFLDEKFAYYACLSLRLPDRGYSRHYSFLKRSKFPVAPFEEQRRIVAKIEELFSELDKGVESLKTAREQLKVYRQAVLKHAFEGKLTEQWRALNSAPPWIETELGEQLSFLTSGSRGWAKFYSQQGDIFIRAQNLKYDHLDLEDIAYVELPEKSEGMRTKVNVGDLLITITGANVTKTGFIKSSLGTAYVSQHVALARPIEGNKTEFLYWYLVAHSGGRKQLEEMAYGAGKPGLNLQNIRSVKLSLPSREEQVEIVSRIYEMLSLAENVSAQIEEQLSRAETLRHAILKEAFSGQLVEQDPKDEPASDLLERIKAEKNQQTNKMKNNKRKNAA